LDAGVINPCPDTRVIFVEITCLPVQMIQRCSESNRVLAGP
jgi:hypothetical protein